MHCRRLGDAFELERTRVTGRTRNEAREVLAEKQPLAQFPGETLDARGHIDRSSDAREIEAAEAPYVPVGDVPDVESGPEVELRLSRSSSLYVERVESLSSA